MRLSAASLRGQTRDSPSIHFVVRTNVKEMYFVFNDFDTQNNPIRICQADGLSAFEFAVQRMESERRVVRVGFQFVQNS